MYSYPLFERLKAEAPEFEEMAAFQAGGEPPERPAQRHHRRRQAAARRVRDRQLLLDVRRRRVRGPRLHAPPTTRRRPTPVGGAEPSRLAGGIRRRSRRSSARRSSSQGHPLTIVGIAPAGFFGETLRGDPPDLWLPLQQEPFIDGDGTLLRQSVSAWLRVIGRLRPGASVEGVAPRLTGAAPQLARNTTPATRQTGCRT